MGIAARLGRRAVFALDRFLRRRFAIAEYSGHADCILRAAIVPARIDRVLADGSAVVRGRPVADLHLWSERAPPLPPHGADLAWAVGFDRQLRISLAELAAYIARHPELGVDAVRLETFFGRPGIDMARFGRRYGFELARAGAAPGLGAQIHRFFAGLLFLALTWAYNPASLAGKRLRRQHDEFWMSRATLDARYGAKRN
jgi:hypothetical protein